MVPHDGADFNPVRCLYPEQSSFTPRHAEGKFRRAARTDAQRNTMLEVWDMLRPDHR